ncbi:type II toxin-antitoxin system VapC family toxin [Methanosarcina acetivorans]|nr:type II toxin-antitoxin system VapC family toxin [Methanosarcina acetivorans]
MKFFVDTSIFVDCLRKEVIPSSKSFLERIGDEYSGYTSSITVAELSVGAHLSRSQDALEKTLELLNIVEVIDLDSRIAIDAGKIYADLIRSGKRIELNDCLIAATALSLGINRE